MKKRLFIIGLCLAQQIVALAQIKVADDTYKETLTASKYVTEPLEIDNVLVPYDGTYLRGATIIGDFENANIVGDTLYTTGFLAGNDCIFVNHVEKKMNVFAYEKEERVQIPEGYWRVTALYLCKDVGNKELSDEIFSLKDAGYEYIIPRWGGYKIDKDYLEKSLAEWQYSSKTNLASVNESVERKKMNGDKSPWTINQLFGGAIHKLESMDSKYTCYLAIQGYVSSHFIPLSYYNFLCRELKGQDVLMTYNGTYGTIPNYISSNNKELKDALTGMTVFQKDTLFHCTDVVVNENNGLETVCILEGKNTGKFAVPVTRLVEQQEKWTSLYYLPTGEVSIFPYKSLQASDGDLVRGRYFKIDGYNNSRMIIKLSDLNSIISETKAYLALTAEQKKKEIATYKALEEKRKQEIIQKYGNGYGTLIANKKVALGMTPEMCRRAWGYPTKITNVVDATGTYTVWRYNFSTYIYFLNGKVVKIQN